MSVQRSLFLIKRIRSSVSKLRVSSTLNSSLFTTHIFEYFHTDSYLESQLNRLLNLLPNSKLDDPPA